MTAANLMGLSRLALSLVAAGLLIHGGSPFNVVAAAVTGLAIITDILDGHFARRYSTVSTLGIFLDVTADKVFLCPLLFLIANGEDLRLWIAVLFLGREFLVMGLRAHAAANGHVMTARPFGKLKTILLYPAVMLALLNSSLADGFLIAATLAALVSLADYIHQSRPWLSAELSGRPTVARPAP